MDLGGEGSDLARNQDAKYAFKLHEKQTFTILTSTETAIILNISFIGSLVYIVDDLYQQSYFFVIFCPENSIETREFTRVRLDEK